MEKHFKPVQFTHVEDINGTIFLNAYVDTNELTSPSFFRCRSYDTLYEKIGIENYEDVLNNRFTVDEIVERLILDNTYYKDPSVIGDIGITFIKDRRNDTDYKSYKMVKRFSNDTCSMKNIFHDGPINISMGEEMSLALGMYLKSTGCYDYGLDKPRVICLLAAHEEKMLDRFIEKYGLDKQRLYNKFDTYFYKNMRRILESGDMVSVFLTLYVLSERKNSLDASKYTKRFNTWFKA